MWSRRRDPLELVDGRTGHLTVVADTRPVGEGSMSAEVPDDVELKPTAKQSAEAGQETPFSWLAIRPAGLGLAATDQVPVGVVVGAVVWAAASAAGHTADGQAGDRPVPPSTTNPKATTRAEIVPRQACMAVPPPSCPRPWSHRFCAPSRARSLPGTHPTSSLANSLEPA